jgi:hypothetical protein
MLHFIIEHELHRRGVHYIVGNGIVLVEPVLNHINSDLRIQLSQCIEVKALIDQLLTY